MSFVLRITYSFRKISWLQFDTKFVIMDFQLAEIHDDLLEMMTFQKMHYCHTTQNRCSKTQNNALNKRYTFHSPSACKRLGYSDALSWQASVEPVFSHTFHFKFE